PEDLRAQAEEYREKLMDEVAEVSEALMERYLDSAAIEVLFDLSRRLGRRRQELRLVMPPGSPLKRVIELTEVHTAAPVHESLEEALTE
ncbi:MAG TPA: STAS domain-containing protein, partial [Thermoleophilaceae bacterium]|nr:STAS domain-containing protein [Thermoleophilaceae bacterium]